MIFAALYFYLNELKRAQKLSKINMAKNERKISSFAGVGALQSRMQNYIDNANEMYL